MNFYDFLIYLLIGALATTGWFAITRGRKEKLPDGTQVQKGKLFKGWYFYWTATTGKKNINYKGESLRRLHDLYLSEYGSDMFLLKVDQTESFLIFSDQYSVDQRIINKSLFLQKKQEFESRLDCLCRVDGEAVVCYKEYSVYRFPEWVRDPLAECATCFASLYGSVLYWVPIWLRKEPSFTWAAQPLFASLFFWIVYCMSLAFLNTGLAKKFL